ncbi:ATP-binding protein [Streptomyces flaveolus]|uniref:ATP-binding protein n=1 Tax=Streptomyces flaveolus TaxID=67297 RepID=A0ABV1VJH0_9ACTN
MHGAEGCIRASRFPSRKSLEDFEFDHQQSVRGETFTHVRALDLDAAKETLSSRPARDRGTHLATGLAIRACQAGRRCAFATCPVGHPARRGPRGRQAHPPGPKRADCGRRGRLHPREPVSSSCLGPL